MNKVFMISDTHFGHTNIIKYENRPFESVKEMDDALINNWNSVVRKNDIVYHLGDFAFNYDEEKLTSLLSRLNGRKVLILGNHDINHNTKFWRNVGFEEVYCYPIIYKGFYILSHEPLYLNDHMPYVNLHGHIHSKKYDSTQYVNLSVEVINYTPVLFDDIKTQFEIGEDNE